MIGGVPDQVPEAFEGPGQLAKIAGREVYMRDDQFSRSLEMLDYGRLPDSAVDAEDALLMLAQPYAYVFPSDSTLAMLARLDIPGACAVKRQS